MFTAAASTIIVTVLTLTLSIPITISLITVCLFKLISRLSSHSIAKSLRNCDLTLPSDGPSGPVSFIPTLSANPNSIPAPFSDRDRERGRVRARASPAKAGRAGVECVVVTSSANVRVLRASDYCELAAWEPAAWAESTASSGGDQIEHVAMHESVGGNNEAEGGVIPIVVSTTNTVR